LLDVFEKIELGLKPQRVYDVDEKFFGDFDKKYPTQHVPSFLLRLSQRHSPQGKSANVNCYPALGIVIIVCSAKNLGLVFR
jgi:hypothetical protein